MLKDFWGNITDNNIKHHIHTCSLRFDRGVVNVVIS